MLAYLSGSQSAPTLDVEVDFKKELNAIHNASSSEQMVHLSNALYDQVAAERSLKEIYKKPNDYFNEFKESLDRQMPVLDNMQAEVATQHESVAKTLEVSKSYKSINPKLQLKLSLIDPKNT